MAKDWKELLLRSGLPLEYEVACLLSDHGFHVEADFSYMRMDVEGVKEHSVDMLCEFWDESGYIVQLLVECKHRSPEKRLLLLHDPNMDWSPITLGGTVHCYDEFVPFHVKGNCFVDLEWKYPIVYKGVELHSGDAVEADFRRAIQQLRYATPTAVLRALEIGLYGHPADAHVLYHSKIIVTNAEMLLVHADVNVDKVQHAAAVEDLSEVTTGAILFSDYGPHYERHFRRVFGDDEDTIIETSVERKKARFSQQAVSFDEKYLRSKAGRVPRD